MKMQRGLILLFIGILAVSGIQPVPAQRSKIETQPSEKLLTIASTAFSTRISVSSALISPTYKSYISIGTDYFFIF